MIGIVFATRREADPFLDQIAAKPLDSGPFPLFRGTASHPPCLTIISGMGKVAAAMAAMHLVLERQVSLLVSAGLCGKLTQDRPWGVGDLLRIVNAVEGDCDRFGQNEPSVECHSGWFGDLEPARLVTCDRPVFDAARRARLAGNGDLADMEGAAVARVARVYKIPCAMIKGISDTADETGRQAVADQIDKVSARIAAALVRELEKQQR